MCYLISWWERLHVIFNLFEKKNVALAVLSSTILFFFILVESVIIQARATYQPCL